MGSLAKYIFSSPNCGLVWKIKLSSYARLSVCMSRLRGETKAVPGCVSHFRGGRRTALLVNITRICELYFPICIVFDWAHFRAGRAFLPVDITAITDYPHQNLTLIYLGKVHQTLLHISRLEKSYIHIFLKLFCKNWCCHVVRVNVTWLCWLQSVTFSCVFISCDSYVDCVIRPFFLFSFKLWNVRDQRSTTGA